MIRLEDISVDKSLKEPLYQQIVNKIKDLIQSGQIEVEDKLPPIRSLAKHLGVNNVTVVTAYQSLADEEITYKIRGSGSYIAPKSDELLAQISEFDNAENQVYKMKDNQMILSQETINFATATPKSNLFPVTDFKKAINFVLDRDLGEAFGYQEAKGYQSLRESIASYLRHQNIQTRLENLQIISGAQQGLDIVSKAVLNYNDVVLVEAPTYSGAIASFRSRGVKIVQIPMQVDGVNMTKLEEIIKRYKPKMMYTMINCQNPTGFSYTHKKKELLLKLASEHHMYVLEDDYVSELIYSKQKSLSLKSLDVHDRVIYIKSFSKILMPGLRLGFMIVPDTLNQTVLNAKQATDISTSGLIQKAFDVYLRNGQWEKQLSNMKKIYQRKFDKMVEALNAYLPRSVHYYVPKGGILFWLELPKGKDSRDFFEKVKHKEVAFVPGDMFYYTDRKSNAIRLSIAAVAEEDIELGVKKLSQALVDYLNQEAVERLPIL
ncbi:PLP-dependent aminotransferase family protein [Acidaminobacter sp. JC074]|uniref:MocR-like pyridoxine biosynthesis transcription factor PdxR n=1 Tax=Acidaminobacter sp. JC074 TaxID=2530199 RepID=UPI001F0FC715|nr:PLP-dependent aminotransferase family protein [Acidaminobacter sp. JC074]MCH4890750.1 PLP-dependent aminotransferase family protein [Acidaminobacter sp. JC074]